MYDQQPPSEAARDSGLTKGSTSRPKVESGVEHDGTAVEESPTSLDNNESLPGPVSRAASDGGRPKNLSEAERKEVYRATPKFRIHWPDDDTERKTLMDALYAARQRSSRLMNAMMYHLRRKDEAALYAFVEERGRMPKTAKEWPFEPDNIYQVGRKFDPSHVSGAVSAMARAVTKKWAKHRYTCLVLNTENVPFYRRTQPILIRAQELKFHPHPKGMVARFALESGRNKQLELVIRADDAYHRDIVHKLLTGQAAYGDAHLQEHPRKRGRWFFSVAYKRVIDRTDHVKAAAINRGMRCFLAMVTEEGESWLYDANDILSTLKQFQRRRQKYQRDAKASGRAGRGRKRILRPIKPLLAKGENWRHSKCQLIARRAAQWLHDRGVGVLYIEDFTGIRNGEKPFEKYVENLLHEWPYYKLETMLKSALEDYGIETVSVSPEFITQRCNSCGHTSEENISFQRWQMVCVECGHRAHLDKNAAANVLHRGGEGSRSGSSGSKKSQRKTKSRRGRQRTSRKTSGKSPKRGGNGATGRKS